MWVLDRPDKPSREELLTSATPHLECELSMQLLTGMLWGGGMLSPGIPLHLFIPRTDASLVLLYIISCHHHTAVQPNYPIPTITQYFPVRLKNCECHMGLSLTQDKDLEKVTKYTVYPQKYYLNMVMKRSALKICQTLTANG